MNSIICDSGSMALPRHESDHQGLQGTTCVFLDVRLRRSIGEANCDACLLYEAFSSSFNFNPNPKPLNPLILHLYKSYINSHKNGGAAPLQFLN